MSGVKAKQEVYEFNEDVTDLLLGRPVLNDVGEVAHKRRIELSDEIDRVEQVGVELI